MVSDFVVRDGSFVAGNRDAGRISRSTGYTNIDQPTARGSPSCPPPPPVEVRLGLLLLRRAEP
jgi:hypothetical protein